MSATAKPKSTSFGIPKTKVGLEQAWNYYVVKNGVYMFFLALAYLLGSMRFQLPWVCPLVLTTNAKVLTRLFCFLASGELLAKFTRKFI